MSDEMGTTTTVPTEQANHTPGKWDFGAIYPMSGTAGGTVTVHKEMGISHYVVRSRFQDEQDRRVTVFVAQAQITSGREQEAKANAQLMSAAPDLLAALKDILARDDYEIGLCDGDGGGPGESCPYATRELRMAIGGAQIAIAKAEGRTP